MTASNADQYLVAARMWIGGTDRVHEGQWVDHFGPLSYTNWWTSGGSSEPDNYQNIQHCAFTNFQGRGVWGDIQGNAELPCYACQTSQI